MLGRAPLSAWEWAGFHETNCELDRASQDDKRDLTHGASLPPLCYIMKFMIKIDYVDKSEIRMIILTMDCDDARPIWTAPGGKQTAVDRAEGIRRRNRAVQLESRNRNFFYLNMARNSLKRPVSKNKR